LHNEAHMVHTPCQSSSRRMGWEGHVAGMLGRKEKYRQDFDWKT